MWEVLLEEFHAVHLVAVFDPHLVHPTSDESMFAKLTDN
jgi:hypothetical protein